VAERLEITTIVLMLEPLVMKIFNDGLEGLPMVISKLETLRKVILVPRLPASTFDPNRTKCLDYGPIYKVDSFGYIQIPQFRSNVPNFSQRVQGVIKRIQDPWLMKRRPLLDIVISDLVMGMRGQ
jgi:hypothetical protein